MSWVLLYTMTKTDCHDTTEIFLKVALNTTNHKIINHNLFMSEEE